MHKVLVVFGTRPDAIKLAPVIRELQKQGSIVPRVVRTGQHSTLLDRTARLFGIQTHHDLDVMAEDQSLFHIAGRVLERIAPVLEAEAPDLVIVQGDTSTASIAALSSFYLKIPVAHVEAGLRTGDKYDPFPEECNRRMIAGLADLHFAPTATARDNLLREGIPAETIFVTGNTGVDALTAYLREADLDRDEAGWTPFSRGETGKTILVTAHRRENHGPPLEDICEALDRVVRLHPELRCVFPVHPNPRVRSVVEQRLSGHDRITLLSPLGYGEFIGLMRHCWLVMTDSGGIQEEAPSLGKPVLVLRNRTERPEGVSAGIARLVGTDPSRIVEEVAMLLSEPDRYQRMVPLANPYGDGKASQRIVEILLGWLAHHRP